MSVVVTKTGAGRAEIAWTQDDDPHGWLDRAVLGDELAYALQVLGAAPNPDDDAQALDAVRYAVRVARLLEARAAVRVVALRDDHGMSWRKIAATVHGDPDMQSSVRRQYDAGRRQLGY